MNDRGKLGNFLNEVIDWNWLEFVTAEHDPKYTGIQAAVFKLIRTCSDGKLSAIKLAIDRVDGKVETPIKIEYPKVFFLFPEAQTVALPGPNDPGTKLLTDPLPEQPSEVEDEEQTIATLTLRQTLEKMADYSRQTPLLIHQQKKLVEQAFEKNEQMDEKEIPLVKAVLCANLLILAYEKGSFEAITELFDRIDGKLVEVTRILGDDIFLTYYAEEAPAGAVKNKDGIYMLESPLIADVWRQKFDAKR